MKSRGTIITIGIICFLLMFMITCQIKTISKSDSEILRLKNENELRDEVSQWKEMYNQVVDTNNELRNQIEEYQNASTKSNSTAALIKKELDNVNVFAGLTDVKGKGIKVTIDETKARNQIALDSGMYDPNVYIVQYTDLLNLINDLKIAGAEAISVNNQRISSRTEIGGVGPFISINGAKYASHFEIYAIGNPDSLETSMKLKGGILDTLKLVDVDVNIEKIDEVIIPKYEKAITNKYASPVE